MAFLKCFLFYFPEEKYSISGVGICIGTREKGTVDMKELTYRELVELPPSSYTLVDVRDPLRIQYGMRKKN